MKETTTFDKLRKALPRGFSRITAERLAAKGITVTPRLVQYVASGKSHNADIEAELLLLLSEPTPKSPFEIQVEKKLAELQNP